MPCPPLGVSPGGGQPSRRGGAGSTEVARSAVGEVVYSILRGNELIKVTAHKPQASTRLGVTVKNITAVRMVNL